MKISIVLKQPPPNFLAPYPAINALNQFGIYQFSSKNSKTHAIYVLVNYLIMKLSRINRD
jgi:hypothetical protein